MKQNAPHWIELHTVILISSLKDRWLLPNRFDSAIFDPTRDQVPWSKTPTFWQCCVTVTGCPPVSVLQSNRMRGNYSYLQTVTFSSHSFNTNALNTHKTNSQTATFHRTLFLLYSVSTKMLISVANLKWPLGWNKTS